MCLQLAEIQINCASVVQMFQLPKSPLPKGVQIHEDALYLRDGAIATATL